MTVTTTPTQLITSVYDAFKRGDIGYILNLVGLTLPSGSQKCCHEEAITVAGREPSSAFRSLMPPWRPFRSKSIKVSSTEKKCFVRDLRGPKP